MLSKTAQIAGPTPANRLVTRTAAKNSTNGAPVPVNGMSQILRTNALATAAMPKRYRRGCSGTAVVKPHDCSGARKVL